MKSALPTEDDASPANSLPELVEFQVVDATLQPEMFCSKLVIRALEIHHQPSALRHVIREVMHEAAPFILIVDL